MPDIVLAKDEPYWISYMKQRIKKNKNFLGFISGQTGSGKSYASLSIGEMVDPEFHVGRIVFGGRELMDLINSGELKKGSCIIFEETGVEMNNRNWASITNKMLNYLLQTFRHRNFIMIMNSPYMDFVDAGTRKLFHAEMTTTGINFTKKTCRLKPVLIQYNSRIQKFYYKRLRVIMKEGVVPIDFWNVPKPSKELVKQYEIKKTAYTDDLNRRILEEFDREDRKLMKNLQLSEIQKHTLDLLKEGMNASQIAEVRGVNRHVVKSTINAMRRKGYTLEPVREGGKVVGYDIIVPELKQRGYITQQEAT